MELYVALFSGVIVALALWWKSSSKDKRPPSVWGLPIVGYLPFLTDKPYLTFTRLAKRYGNIFSVRLGSLNVLILNDYKSTKEAFAKDEFIGRPPESPFVLNKETVATGAIFGLAWKEQRRESLHLLKDVGLGKSKMEAHIQEEIDELLDHFEKNVDKPFCMRTLLSSSMSNNIASILFGKRLEYGHPRRQMLTRLVNEGSKVAGQAALHLFFPWLRKILAFLGIGAADKIVKLTKEAREYFKEEIDEHEKTLDTSNIRDFVDGYLLEVQKRKNDPTFTKPVLQDVLSFVFGGGSDTVEKTMEWLILRAASDQEAQDRIHGEIEGVIGQNRPPIWPDHKKMPYTTAFILEIMRWRTLLPINLLRYTLTDTEVGGYFVPKHTQVMSNNWAIHHDPEYWGPDADEFRPERFLKEDAKEVKKWERNVPFSIGKRACPGEPLAKVEIFLYFVSILQKFNVKMADGKTADFEGELGLSLNPKEQDIVLKKRI